MEINGTIKGVGISLAFLVNIAAVFYWGGTTRQKVDNLDATVQEHIQESRSVNTVQDSDITDLRVRTSVLETACDGAPASGDALLTFDV